MEKHHRHTVNDTIDDLGLTGHAVHHAEGVTLTIEIPHEALTLQTFSDRLGFGAALLKTALEPLQAPQPGTLRVMKGGKA